MKEMNIKIYDLLKSEKKLSTECLIAYLDFAVGKEDAKWGFNYSLVLEYGLIPEIISFYYSNPQVQNEYADMLIEHIKDVSNMMRKKDKEKYNTEFPNDEIGCNGSVITVNKILNRIPVKQDDVMNAFINISSSENMKKYIKDKFKNIDVFKLLETVYNKFGRKDNIKSGNTR